MKNIFGKALGIVLGMLCFCIPLWGCAMLEASDKKVSEIDFTVVSPEELPEETSGYSISVNDVYQGEDGIWVDTDFIGPEKSEKTEAAATSPFVVIKIDAVDQTIRFKN